MIPESINVRLLITGYILIALWAVFLSVLQKRGFLSKQNFLGNKTFISYGLIAFPAILLGMNIVLSLGSTDKASFLNYAIILSIMWLGGSIDDLFGNRDTGGFRGHIGAFIKHKKITTGLFKIICGIAAGIVAAVLFSSGSFVKGITAFFLIPLSANTINMFDLRPGRAFGIFCICSLIILLLCRFSIYDWNLCCIVFAVSIVAYYWDRKGDAMMGDSFSNVLGAFLGLLVIMNLPLWFAWICIAANAAVQLFSEKYSITKVIESKAWLRKLDEYTGIRRK